MPPIVAHGNGGNTVPVVRTPTQPKKQRTVRSRVDTSLPTTARNTRSWRREKDPPPKDGGYPSEGDSTHEERYTKNETTPRRRLEGIGLQAWMDDRHICAHQEVVWCMGGVLKPRAWSKALAWCDNLKQRVDKSDRTMLPKLHWWQRLFVFYEQRWFFQEPTMHVFLWDAKGSELYMRPLIQQLRNKGIPRTTKALGFQHLDGWTHGHHSLGLL